jgi:glycosyltransferase involved in cell wall biosynthesis
MLEPKLTPAAEPARLDRARLRIAIVAPLWERVPPPRYGAVETLVAALADGLVARGHDVTLFASGDSRTSARLRAGCPRALNDDPDVSEPEVHRLVQHLDVRDRAACFDVISSHLHSHTGCLGLALLDGAATPVVHTVHCSFTRENLALFRRFPGADLVAISDWQRSTAPGLRFRRTILHGVALAAFAFRPRPADPPYIAYLGRLSPAKGPHVAIEVARRAGVAIRLAGRVKPADREYFDTQIGPHVDGGRVQFVGELGLRAKESLLGGALATVFPSQWPEPFGLVMAESLACGTPVIACGRGAAGEVVRHGRTGFVSSSAAAMAEAVGRVASLDRRTCRREAERRFDVARMVDDYEDLLIAVSRELDPARAARVEAARRASAP